MSAHHKNLIREYIEKVVNTGDTSNIEQYISEDYAEVYQNQRYQVGIDGAREHIRGVRNTYPDLKLSITQQIAEGDWVVTCYSMQGTHSGEWMGINPTGKSMEATGINIDRIINGKITEHGGAANLLEGLLSIGAIQIVK